MKYSLRLLSILLLLGAFLTACGSTTADTEVETEQPAAESTAELEALKAEVVANYADMVYANYVDAYETAVTLQTALQTFVANPSEETHQAAKDAWLAAREPLPPCATRSV